MPRVNGILISYCGLVCEYCKAYLTGKCGGCDQHVNECPYIKCAIERNVKTCLSCKFFPCKLHREGFTWETEEHGKLKWRVYSDVFMEILSAIRG